MKGRGRKADGRRDESNALSSRSYEDDDARAKGPKKFFKNAPLHYFLLTSLKR